MNPQSPPHPDKLLAYFQVPLFDSYQLPHLLPPFAAVYQPHHIRRLTAKTYRRSYYFGPAHQPPYFTQKRVISFLLSPDSYRTS